MSVRLAVTFGQKYAHTEHPRLPFAHPSGYIVVEAETYEQAREFIAVIVGEGENGAPAYAFAYDYDEWVAKEAARELREVEPDPETGLYGAGRYCPRGCLAAYSALPRALGAALDLEFVEARFLA